MPATASERPLSQGDSDRPASDGGPGRVGLLAGWGRFPVVVAEALGRQGFHTYCIGVRGYADPSLAEICHDFHWGSLARFGSAIRYFRRHGVTQATMAGKIHKAFMFQPWFWIRLMPDLRTVRAFAPHFLSRRRDCKDDTLLGRVVELFAADGIRFGPATDYAPELLVKAGQLTRRGPSAFEWKDIRFGWQIAKEMGRLDVGQSVAVKSQAVLAVEAVEGTDECIRRAGQLCRAGEFTVVKVSKPQQDMRFDVPTIGLGTVQTMLEAGARVLAIEADRTIVVDQQEVVEFADRSKLVIVALRDADLGGVTPTT
ncbi:MAG: UDP-2,3-diacylglucosamine diphosphatase LpxI [Pirellulales bacterium]|nr:UDP-2,3-diacylglucosamine diphosphatase LpxI [Pirellulales bacterium]